MSLPLVVASTDNKVDLWLRLEDCCTADVLRMTRQLTLHWYISGDIMCSISTKSRFVCVCLCTWACVHTSGQCLSLSLSHKSQSSSAGSQSQIATHKQRERERIDLIPVMIHTLISPYIPNDWLQTVYHAVRSKTWQSKWVQWAIFWSDSS